MAFLSPIILEARQALRRVRTHGEEGHTISVVWVDVLEAPQLGAANRSPSREKVQEHRTALP